MKVIQEMMKIGEEIESCDFLMEMEVFEEGGMRRWEGWSLQRFSMRGVRFGWLGLGEGWEGEGERVLVGGVGWGIFFFYECVGGDKGWGGREGRNGGRKEGRKEGREKENGQTERIQAES